MVKLINFFPAAEFDSAGSTRRLDSVGSTRRLRFGGNDSAGPTRRARLGGSTRRARLSVFDLPRAGITILIPSAVV